MIVNKSENIALSVRTDCIVIRSFYVKLADSTIHQDQKQYQNAVVCMQRYLNLFSKKCIHNMTINFLNWQITNDNTWIKNMKMKMRVN